MNHMLTTSIFANRKRLAEPRPAASQVYLVARCTTRNRDAKYGRGA